MAEVPNYPSNSRKSREKEVQVITSVPENQPPKGEPVVEGNVTLKKPSLGKRLRESFAGDDAPTVGQYVVFDVVMPAVKSMVVDVVSQGIERLLYGDTGRSRTSGGNGRRQFTDYSSRSSSRVGRPDPRETTRATGIDGYRDLQFETRADAELVIDRMRDQLQEYGVCTVAYLYECANVTAVTNFQDNKWGWFDLRGVGIRGTLRSGYIIDLPRPQPID